MNKGKFIVLEGADGTGKTTQAKLLVNYLKKRKFPVVSFSFPRYGSAWGKMIRRYLNGDFGDVGEVDPYLASMLYAGDRLLASDKINKWMSEGKIVVCDRYMASNIAHQSAKIKDKKSKIKYIKWLEDLEYAVHGIPKPDQVILLTIPTATAQQFMKKRVMDIHEVDVAYQRIVAKTFIDYAKDKKNWFVVSNVDGNKLRSLEEVNKDIISILRTKSVLRVEP